VVGARTAAPRATAVTKVSAILWNMFTSIDLARPWPVDRRRKRWGVLWRSG
jgi:hypothetical protein